MNPRDNVTLSAVYLLFGIGGILGAASSLSYVLFLGLPITILICGIIQGLLGVYMLFRYFQRSRKRLTVFTLVVVIACFLINGGFAINRFYQFVDLL